MGTPSAGVVQERARELARIDGRSEVRQSDWRRANLELHGGHAASSIESDGDGFAAISHGLTVGSSGRRLETHSPENYENLGEELIAEGMDEAIHEQMLAAANRDEEDLV